VEWNAVLLGSQGQTGQTSQTGQTGQTGAATLPPMTDAMAHALNSAICEETNLIGAVRLHPNLYNQGTQHSSLLHPHCIGLADMLPLLPLSWPATKGKAPLLITAHVACHVACQNMKADLARGRFPEPSKQMAPAAEQLEILHDSCKRRLPTKVKRDNYQSCIGNSFSELSAYHCVNS